jgi:hypothetical protein
MLVWRIWGELEKAVGGCGSQLPKSTCQKQSDIAYVMQWPPRRRPRFMTPTREDQNFSSSGVLVELNPLFCNPLPPFRVA